jgi:hypothetical protein
LHAASGVLPREAGNLRDDTDVLLLAGKRLSGRRRVQRDQSRRSPVRLGVIRRVGGGAGDTLNLDGLGVDVAAGWDGRCCVRLAGCKRRRTVKHYGCSGVPHAPVDVGVCDGCVTDADCVARPGGRCAPHGGGICESPPAHVCRYPGDVCDGCPFCTNNGNGAAVCKRQQTPPPP